MITYRMCVCVYVVFLSIYFSLFIEKKYMNQLRLDMSKWANPAHTGWLTTSRVENEWTQPGSFYGEPEIL